MNIQTVSTALYEAFVKLNDHYFKNLLPEPMIVVSPLAKQKTHGMFYFDKLWFNDDKTIQKFEIVIAAETLNRPYLQVITTLLHEMTHLHCKMKEIKETSKKGRFHNAKFKEECESHGMKFDMAEIDPKMGWFEPVLTDDSIEVIKSFKLDPETFKLARIAPEKKKKVKPVYKYQCPSCELKIRLRKEANLKCNDCDQDLVEYGNEADEGEE